jgi:hypothetical protein
VTPFTLVLTDFKAQLFSIIFKVRISHALGRHGSFSTSVFPCVSMANWDYELSKGTNGVFKVM